MSPEGPLLRRYEGLPLSVGLGNWNLRLQQTNALRTLDPQQRSGALSITLSEQGTQPPWRGLGGTLPPCCAGLWSIRGEYPMLQVHVPPQQEPIGLDLCQQNQCLRAEPRRLRPGGAGAGVCGAGAGSGKQDPSAQLCAFQSYCQCKTVYAARSCLTPGFLSSSSAAGGRAL